MLTNRGSFNLEKVPWKVYLSICKTIGQNRGQYRVIHGHKPNITYIPAILKKAKLLFTISSEEILNKSRLQCMTVLSLPKSNMCFSPF